MNIKVNDDEMLTILKAVYGEFISSKIYYENHKSDEERIGIISPKEYMDIYNNLLKQSHEQGELLELNLIK